jgi:hypothetical protein
MAFPPNFRIFSVALQWLVSLLTEKDKGIQPGIYPDDQR